VAFDDKPTDEMERGPAAATQLADRPLLVRNRRLGDGRYVLERPLGHGGMAAVWLAHDVILERPVAVKVLSDTLAGDEEFLARFRREAQVAAGLSHPNLVGVYDFDAGGERPYLVMEYVSGGDLGERLAAGEARDAAEDALLAARSAVPDVGRLAAELLDALRHIHDAGVLHRDVKPQNVLIDEDGRAKLTDFGIAQPRDATSITQTGKVLGTERYLAPEVLQGKRNSERSDLYAVGVVLAEAAREGVSFGVWELIDRLRAEDPLERPASALAALAELERISPAAKPAGEPTQAYEPAPTVESPPPPPPSARASTPPAPDGDRGGLFASPDRRLVIGGLAALVVAVALAVGLALGGDEGDPIDDLGAKVQQDGEGAGGGGEEQSGDEANTPPADTTEEPPADAAADASASGAELNDQGFALINEGRYDEAIPILQQAVEKLAPIGDLNYAYALYNLGHALRLAGRPEEAIPILEQRLEIPNQTEVVQRELDAARAEAGVDDSSGPGSGEEPPGNAFGHDKKGKDNGGDD
jgi:eukaryotic-like serine/threonine-protein kinase